MATYFHTEDSQIDLVSSDDMDSRTDVFNTDTAPTQTRPSTSPADDDTGKQNRIGPSEKENPKIANGKLSMSPDELLDIINTMVRNSTPITYSSNLNTTSTNDRDALVHGSPVLATVPNNVNIDHYYSLTPDTIPPYVIERLKHFPDSYDHGDPFTSTFLTPKNNIDWGDFLQTLKIPTSNIPVKVNKIQEKSSLNPLNIPVGYCHSITSSCSSTTFEMSKRRMAEQIFEEYDLNQKWEGHKRLNELYGTVEKRGDKKKDDLNEENSTGQSSDGGSSSSNDEKINRIQPRKLRYLAQREEEIKNRARYWIAENKKNWKPKLFESVKTNSYFPLFFRLISLSLTTVALGISAKLVALAQEYDATQQPSPLMALIVQACAIVYLLCVTYDEFTSQPLGLRNPRAKIRLILLDLFFIIFSSANLSLCFESIFDSRWVCVVGLPGDPLYNSSMCKKVKALTAFIFVTLVVWCINFTISVFRVVHTVTYIGDKA